MPSRLVIKVCGLKDSENAREIATLGIDYAGFVFFEDSSRNARGRVNKDFLIELADSCTPVAVLVNESVEAVCSLHEELGFRALQLHGSETPGYCRALKKDLPGLLCLKAFGICEAFDFSITKDYEDSCSYFLFDTRTKSHGGSGRKFDWQQLLRYQGKTPFFLSGGISPGDAQSIKTLAANLPLLAGVDLNSGFEIEPGLKSPALISEFLKELTQ